MKRASMWTLWQKSWVHGSSCKLGWLCTGGEASERDPGEDGKRIQSLQSSLRVTAEVQQRAGGAGVHMGRKQDRISRDPVF